MSQAEQAQKGFKTFILTLSISLIVFSAVYYVITNGSLHRSTPDIESSDTSSKSSTVFGQLANQKVTDTSKGVLAAEDTTTDAEIDSLLADGTTGTTTTTTTTAEPTQASGTPNGGVTSITLGLFTSIAIFMYGLFVISRDPRRLALKRFEDRITDD